MTQHGATSGSVCPRIVRIGVTGHRPNHLNLANDALLRSRIRTVLSCAGDAAPGTVVTVISALAEGVDQLVAEEALANGCALTCLLPFAVSDYIQDFSSTSVISRFNTLLALATDVVVLPGSLITPQIQTAAYAVVGREIVNGSDLLLAIWDGAPARGAGGTAEVVALARERPIPVIWIAASAPHGLQIISGEHAAEHIRDVVTAIDRDLSGPPSAPSVDDSRR